jgi:hypothetical protein
MTDDGSAPPEGGGQKPRRVELNLDADTARGRYANATVVSHGRHEVVLDFIAALPHHRPQVVSRLVLPREQAEALAQTLRRTLDAARAQPGTAVPSARSDEDPN